MSVKINKKKKIQKQNKTKKTQITDIKVKYEIYKKNRKTLIFKKLDNIPEVIVDNKSNEKYVCIIIPYRNRRQHLARFMKYIEGTNIDVYIINQNNSDKFNRGLLLNIGYYIASRSSNKYKRYIFHDVDSYPDEKLIKYYSVELNKNIHFASNNYKYSFPEFLGGVIGFTEKDFINTNGFPNTFFGWGGEDDALYNRCVSAKIPIYRPRDGEYILDEHSSPTKEEYNKNKKENILNDVTKWTSNGVHQLNDLYINYVEFSNISTKHHSNFPEKSLGDYTTSSHSGSGKMDTHQSESNITEQDKKSMSVQHRNLNSNLWLKNKYLKGKKVMRFLSEPRRIGLHTIVPLSNTDKSFSIKKHQSNFRNLSNENYDFMKVLKFFENPSSNDNDFTSIALSSNLTTPATLLKDYKEDTEYSSQQFRIFNIDYLATHTLNSSKIEDVNFVNDYVKDKINKFHNNGIKIYQHHNNPTIISVIQPIIHWNEIHHHIIDTYTSPKRFKMGNKTKIDTDFDNIVDSEFRNYKKELTKTNLEETLGFLFYNYGEFIYIRIRNGNIECAYNIYNMNLYTDWYSELTYKKQSLDKSVTELIIDRGSRYNTIKRPHYISANGCLLNLESYNYYEGNPYSYISEFMEMIKATISKYGEKAIADCDLIINRKDFPYLNNKHGYAYNHLRSKTHDFSISKWWPVFSQSTCSNNLDIAIPSSDEWNRLKEINIKEYEWKNKKDIAVFRGKSTGCGSTSTENPRIKLAEIGKLKEVKELMDVGLSGLTNRITAYNREIKLTSFSEYKHLLSPTLDFNHQSNYKYIFNVEGNAAAYRFPTEFKHKSVIINIEGEYKMWFEPLLENGKHFIEIPRKDFMKETGKNIVINKVNWLKDNDTKAKEIAESGYNFYLEKLNRNSICDYWFLLMLYMNNYSS